MIEIADAIQALATVVGIVGAALVIALLVIAWVMREAWARRHP